MSFDKKRQSADSDFCIIKLEALCAIDASPFCDAMFYDPELFGKHTSFGKLHCAGCSKLSAHLSPTLSRQFERRSR